MTLEVNRNIKSPAIAGLFYFPLDFLIIFGQPLPQVHEYSTIL